MNFFKKLRNYGKYILSVDPACHSVAEALLTYPVVRSLINHRIAHWFYERDHRLIARIISQRARKKTGIEIHPGAQIGDYLFIDHGMGVVIGETAIIGDYVTMYHGVTLGGTGNEKDVKRHPTIGNHCFIGTGAKILGPVVLGDFVRVGANAVVLDSVPMDCTAVGAPARYIKNVKKRKIVHYHPGRESFHSEFNYPKEVKFFEDNPVKKERVCK